MRLPELVTVFFFAYLAAVSVVTKRARARVVSLALAAAAMAAALGLLRAEALPWTELAAGVWPLIFLFAGYRLAGLLFERPDTALEQRLLRIDHMLGQRVTRLAASSRARSRAAAVASRWLEGAYLAVYPIIPLGALVVGLSGSSRDVERFWTIVLASGFACYGALPWVQTRPPRTVEHQAPVPPDSALRRLNLAILAQGSVQVNTLPSGHTATAIATALAVATQVPLAGLVFGVVALLIALATVVGRYHYVVDTVLGALVGVAAWVVTV